MSMISKQIDDLRAYAKDRKGELAKLVSDAADTIEMLSAKLSAANMERSARYYHGGWIPCSERLPRQGQEVICQCRANMIKVLKLDACGDWYQDAEHCYMSGFVIAWMPLPQPPESDGE